ncbi:MAG: hypothetical protein Q9217_006033 [Psora testacea]
MGFFKFFSSSKHTESGRRGTATARSTHCPGLKPPLTNWPGFPRDAGAITPRSEKKQHDTSPSLPTVSRPPRSISTTNLACLAPLEDIGSARSFQPRTAVSTKASKVCLPGGVETGRPATSHAATTDSSFAHLEVETSCVGSKPASAYSKSPQPKRSACPPFPAKPRHLDGDDHPAYRKQLGNDDNVYPCTTDERTELPSLHRSPRRDQQRPQHEGNDQPRVADTSVLSTQGQEPHEPSPLPLPPGTKYTSPSQTTVVTSGTSSSPQLPRRYDQRRAASIRNSPIQGHEPHEPSPPPLPPRPQTTNSTAAPLDTSRSLYSGDSDASTLFSDAECGTAVDLLRAGKASGVFKEDAKKAWSLLSPDEPNLRIRRITDAFCQYFFHVYYALRNGKEIPYQVPVSIRAESDRRYRNAWNKTQDVQKYKNHNLAKWIDALDGEKQGHSLIALLEIRLHTEGPLESRKLLRTILDLKMQVESLRHVSENQISNFFATYVRAFRTNIGQNPDEVLLAESLGYFTDFWFLCTAQYSNQIAGNCLSLFKATITKLENIDIPLCLWIFLAGSGTSGFAQNIDDPAVEEMYLAMETELNARWQPLDILPGVLPALMTVQFLLSAGHSGFFNIMNRLMHAQSRVQTWEKVWRTLRRWEYYIAVSQLTEQYDRTMNEFAIVMARR